MFFDYARKNQITFQDPASPVAEGIIDLHNEIFFWLIFIFVPVVVIFIRILRKSDIVWFPYNHWDVWYNTKFRRIKLMLIDDRAYMQLVYARKLSVLSAKLIHGTLLEIIWTIMPTIILILIAIPSFGLIYAMDSIIDPDWTIKIIGNQWYWSFDFNYSAFIMRDIDELYIALMQKVANPKEVIPQAHYNHLNILQFKKLVVEQTIKLWSHNLKHYLIDSYTLTESALSKTKSIRLLSVDNPLVLPINQNIRVILTASDVLHSFAVPSLGVKLDATPGRLGAISMFIERPGHFFGQCSELCGVGHGVMSIELFAVESQAVDSQAVETKDSRA